MTTASAPSMVPVATPIVYAKRDQFRAETLGEIMPGSPGYDAYRQILEDSVEQGYAKLIQP